MDKENLVPEKKPGSFRKMRSELHGLMRKGRAEEVSMAGGVGIQSLTIFS